MLRKITILFCLAIIVFHCKAQNLPNINVWGNTRLSARTANGDTTGFVTIGQLPFPSSSLDTFKLLIPGQSNAAGVYGGGNEATTDARVTVWNDVAWVLATKDNTHDQYQNPTFTNANNVGFAFAKAFAQKTGRPVKLIVSALGGTAISTFVSGQSQWTRITNQLTASAIGRIDAILWVQGEADINNTTTGWNNYTTTFNTVYNQFIALSQFSDSKPFIICKLGEFQPSYSLWNGIYDNLAVTRPFMTAVSSNGLLSGGDQVHYSGAALDSLGSRALNAYFNLPKSNSPTFFVEKDSLNSIKDNQGLLVYSNANRDTTFGTAITLGLKASGSTSPIAGVARIMATSGATDYSGKLSLGVRRYFTKIGSTDKYYYGDDFIIDQYGRVGHGIAPLASTHLRSLNTSDANYRTLRLDDLITTALGSSSLLAVATNANGNYVYRVSDAFISSGGNSTGYLSKFTGANIIGNSGFYETGGNIGLGTTSSISTKFRVVGTTFISELDSYGSSSYAISIGNGGGSVNYYKANNHYFQNGSGGDAMNINSAGFMALSGVSNASEALHYTGNQLINPSGTANAAMSYYLNQTNTGTNVMRFQAGYGGANYGAGLLLNGHAHSTKPGWFVAALSSGAGSGATEARFTVNDSGQGGGTDVFTVLRSGPVTSTSTITAAQLISNIATGTAPLAVTSTTAVTNLNADMVDGKHASDFVEESEFVAGLSAIGPANGSTTTISFASTYSSYQAVTCPSGGSINLTVNGLKIGGYYIVELLAASGQYCTVTFNSGDVVRVNGAKSPVLIRAISSTAYTIANVGNSNFIAYKDTTQIAQRDVVNTFTEKNTFNKAIQADRVYVQNPNASSTNNYSLIGYNSTTKELETQQQGLFISNSIGTGVSTFNIDCQNKTSIYQELIVNGNSNSTVTISCSNMVGGATLNLVIKNQSTISVTFVFSSSTWGLQLSRTTGSPNNETVASTANSLYLRKAISDGTKMYTESSY